MNINQLQSFVRVAHHGSLARTAAATDLAESLISRHISALESVWGDRLFERTGRGMVLSEFGRFMLPEVCLALEQVERLSAIARESARVPSGTVRVGVLPSLAPQLLPLLFADLRAGAPGVRLQTAEGFSGSLDEGLASGRLDVAVINRYGPAGGCAEELLGSADTCLVGRAGNPLLAKGSISFKSLSNVPLVLPSAPNGLRQTLDQLARRHGIQLNIVMEVDSAASMKDVTLSGYVYTLLPQMAVKEDLARGSLGAVEVVKPAIRRTIVLALTSQHPLSRAARHVAGRIRVLAPQLLR
jgi:LysR family nitrogen assimilation transcriptional regulator